MRRVEVAYFVYEAIPGSDRLKLWGRAKTARRMRSIVDRVYRERSPEKIVVMKQIRSENSTRSSSSFFPHLEYVKTRRY
jgi:hypothetical protein